jgi:hypothetical protein
MLLLGFLSACSVTEPATGPTLLRVENGTGWDMKELTVFVTPRLEVDLLAVGERTGYQEVAQAYRIATVNTRIDNLPHTLQVIDFVGESPLGRGRFTYRLELVGDPGSPLSLTLIEDG